jgi:soluble lytic murein transglycosylase
MHTDSDDPAAPESAPDRDAPPPLSSEKPSEKPGRRRRISLRAGPLAPALVLLSVGAAAATLTLQEAAPPAPPVATVTPAPLPPAHSDPFWAVIDTWSSLRQSDALPFSTYANFLIAHRGWPGEPHLRQAAERAIRTDSDPRLVVDFFTAFPPTTNTGRVHHAEALATLGRAPEAQAAARGAWIGGALAPDDESRLTARFAAGFTPDDQDKRMERLLWDHATAAATRQLGLVSAARRPIYAARLAFQTKAPDAAQTASAAGPAADRDAGFAIDRALWLRDSAQLMAARTYLGTPRGFDAPPYDAAKYLKALLDIAQGAAHDGQGPLAYQMALLADAGFAPGTAIRDRPLSERDPYTSLVWLGGQTALKTLARPKDAEALFVRYGQATQSPGGQAKGQYWAGRAALAAGEAAAATDHFANAAQQVDQFYGQLATERLDKPLAVPPDPVPVAVTPAQRAAFQSSELVHAARLLGQERRWPEQSLFVRKIATDASSDTDHILIDELSRQIGRPDLGVITSRAARASGGRDPLRIGFPIVAVPPAMASHWTIVHALSRQESQFDSQAMSPVGARGLMQLMPATAREQAGKLGLPWDPARLGDTSYNVMLGSAFFDRMLTYYGGNYVLAVASYNAGPGNVNKFLRLNGDPRMGNVDVVDWIEAIPFQETRTYVQKVLENAVVYDLFNPARAHTPERNRLSYYLGKSSGG